ncbi:MAG: hypothetical protein KBA15_11475, partial [Spirochaetes bacterium]|nr:hypothetical protein [Spirochaetota bacterium]
MKKAILLVIFLYASGYAFAQDSDTGTGAERRRNAYNESISAPFAQGRFIPDISLIADFSVTVRDIGDERYESLEVPGLIHAHSHEGEYHHHTAPNARNGFNFNYAELSLYS